MTTILKAARLVRKASPLRPALELELELFPFAVDNRGVTVESRKLRRRQMTAVLSAACQISTASTPRKVFFGAT